MIEYKSYIKYTQNRLVNDIKGETKNTVYIVIKCAIPKKLRSTTTTTKNVLKLKCSMYS